MNKKEIIEIIKNAKETALEFNLSEIIFDKLNNIENESDTDRAYEKVNIILDELLKEKWLSVEGNDGYKERYLWDYENDKNKIEVYNIGNGLEGYLVNNGIKKASEMELLEYIENDLV